MLWLHSQVVAMMTNGSALEISIILLLLLLLLLLLKGIQHSYSIKKYLTMTGFDPVMYSSPLIRSSKLGYGGR